MQSSWWNSYRRHGYFFRQAAMLTISIGFAMHIYQLIFGDALTLQHVVTLTTDRVLLVPTATHLPRLCSQGPFATCC